MQSSLGWDDTIEFSITNNDIVSLQTKCIERWLFSRINLNSHISNLAATVSLLIKQIAINILPNRCRK